MSEQTLCEKLSEQSLIKLEGLLKEALVVASQTHHQMMAASESIGNRNGTGEVHACLALMEISKRALSQSNDAARYARHALRYPSTKGNE